MNRAVVLQASDLLVRGDLAVAPDTVDPQGRPVNTLLAAVKALRRTLKMKNPDAAIAVMGPPPPALAGQAARYPELLALHGFSTVSADDPTAVAASYVNRALADGMDVVVVGYDKRLGQLVGENVWFYDAYKDVRYTPDRIHQRFGVPPEQLAAWLALVGDRYATEGIKGIGAKGAAELLAQYGSVEAALDDLDAIKGRTGNALRAAGAEAVRAAVAEATLDAVAPQPLPVWEAPDPEAVAEVYRSLGFVSLVKARKADAVPICTDPSSLDLAGTVAVEAVISDPSPPRGALVGLALTLGDTTVYVTAENVDALGPWLADPDASKLGHDTKATRIVLRKRGLELRGVVGDTILASHLLDPSGLAPHELPDLAKVYLQRPLRTVDQVRGRGAKRKGFEALKPAVVAAWAGARTEAIRDLWDQIGDRADRALHDEALALSDVLVGMEERGIAVDADSLAGTAEDFEAIRAELEGTIYALAGHDFAINSPKQLGTVLYEELGLPVVARTKTGWSTADHALERLANAHPIVPLVRRWRRLKRLQDSWVTALTAAIDPDGRVRSTFHPARSFSGRLVNAHPDLGRVPGRTPEMERIRKAFRAPPGTTLLSIDYDQLGLYVIAHLTRDPNLVGPLSRGEDIHAATARAVLDKDGIDTDERQLGKVTNFATFAGQGPSALALQLGVDVGEAKVIIDRFFQRYAEVRRFLDLQLHLAQTQGYVTTIAGRPWPIGGLTSKDPMLLGYAERLARRATHEGSVADVTRRGLLHAAVALEAAGLRTAPLLQIHDEILFEVPDGELDRAMAIAGDAMRHAYDLAVPLRVGFKTGPSWGELSEVASPP